MSLVEGKAPVVDEAPVVEGTEPVDKAPAVAGRVPEVSGRAGNKEQPVVERTVDSASGQGTWVG